MVPRNAKRKSFASRQVRGAIGWRCTIERHQVISLNTRAQMSRGLRSLIGLILIYAIVCSLLAWTASDAWARAGGGESYGGGSGNGGGGGGDDGFGWLIYILIRLVFEYPAVGVPLLIVVIVFVVYAGNSTHSGYVTRTIRRGEALQAAGQRQRALARLNAADPQFNEQQFLNRASAAFIKIQDAWSRQDLAPVRPFISDGIRERFSFQFDMQKALGYRNQLDQVRVLGATAAAIISDDTFNTIHVEFRAAAHDYRVDLLSGRRVGSEPVPEEFVEYWSFHRRPGAQTLAHPGALEGHCPHCGAPLEIVDVARCSSCRSIVNSGEHDWVLAEITQAQEWRVPEEEAQVPGLAELKADDPAVCAQHVEDRVSVMFWRIRAAEFFGDPKQVVPIASPRFVAEWSQSLQSFQPKPTAVRPEPTAQRSAWEEGRAREGESNGPAARRFYQDAAVGKVELIEAERAGTDGFDHLRVVVRWSGVLCEGDPLGSHREIAGKAIRTQLFELIRRQGAKSRADATFSSASCPNCGAPIAVSAEAACSFCGTTLNDGRFDWVLDRVGPWSPHMAFAPVSRTGIAPPSRPLGPRARPAARSELSLAILARIAAADGQIDENERKLLADVGARRGLSDEQVEAVLNSSAVADVELPVPGDPREANQYLAEMVRASLVDGNISSQEKRLLVLYAQRMNLAPADVQLEIARQRKERFQAAKGLLRDTKRGTA